MCVLHLKLLLETSVSFYVWELVCVCLRDVASTNSFDVLPITLERSSKDERFYVVAGCVDACVRRGATWRLLCEFVIELQRN